MNRKKFLYIIISITLIIALVIAWFFLTRDPLPDTTQIIPTNDSLLPFGSDIPDDNTTGNSDRPADFISSLFEGELPTLRQITTEPVAAVTTTTRDGVETIRYIERATGHVYEANFGDALVTRISNTTIAGIYDAVWVDNGDSVVARFLKDNVIQTFAGALRAIDPALASEAFTANDGVQFELQGSFLPDNISALTASPDGSKIFYILPSASGSFGVVANPDGTGKETIFSSPLSEWHATWDTNNLITVVSSPSNGIIGLAYTLDVRTNGLSRILTDVAGLTSKVSFDNKKVLYSESARQSDLTLKVRTQSDGALLSTGLRTLVEKCVWSKLQPEVVYCAAPAFLPSGTYPDAWYLGLLSFSDALWRVDTISGSIDIIAALKQQTSQDIDGINLFLNDEETHLFFINKKDSSLWSLELGA